MIARLRALSFAVGLALLACAIQARADRYESQTDLLPPPAQLEDEPPLPQLDAGQKAYLVKLARQAVDHSAQTGKPFQPGDVPASLQGKHYLVYVSARISGKMIHSALGDGGPLAENVARAALAVASSEQFGPDRPVSARESVIELNVLGPGQVLPFPRIEQVSSMIVPGIHGLAARTGKRTVTFKESVAVVHGFHGGLIMQRLLVEAGWTAKQVADNRAKVTFFRFRAVHLLERPAEGGYVELIRCAELIPDELVSAERLDVLIDLVGQHMRNRQLSSGLFSHMYSPATSGYLPGNHGVRQAGAAWAMARLARATGRVEYELSALKAIGAATVRYLDEDRTAACGGYEFEAGQENIGASSLLLAAIVDLPNNQPVAALRDRLAEGILRQQQPDGSLKLYFYDRPDDAQRFTHPGQALLALTKFYQQTGQKKCRDAVERAFKVYHRQFQESPRMVSAAWQSQAWALAHEATGKREFADLVFQMADYMIGFQGNDPVKVRSDELGAVVDRRGEGDVGTTLFAEGVAAAHRLAVRLNDRDRAAKYAAALRRAARFIDQLTFKQAEAFYCIAPREVVGGLKTTPANHSIRIDNCQHGVLALLAIREQLFGELPAAGTKTPRQ